MCQVRTQPVLRRSLSSETMTNTFSISGADNTMSQDITGGCLCEAIRFTTLGPPKNVLYCHCRMCRRATGQPIVAGAYFKLSQVNFERGDPCRYPSSPYAERGFCRDCGTPLFYHSVMPKLRDWLCMMLGTFDHPERYAPTDHWNIETALPYALHDDGLPRHLQADSPYEWVRDSFPKA